MFPWFRTKVCLSFLLKKHYYEEIPCFSSKVLIYILTNNHNATLNIGTSLKRVLTSISFQKQQGRLRKGNVTLACYSSG